MVSLIDLIYQEIGKENPYKRVYDLLSNYIGSSMSNFYKRVYQEYYNNQSEKDVFVKLKKSKFNSRKKQWFEKAIDGFREYQKSGEIKRGIHRHLIDDYFAMCELYETQGQIWFKHTFKKETPADLIEEKIKLLEEWLNSEEMYFVDYIYLKAIPVRLKEKVLELDLAMLIGLWHKNNEEHLESAQIQESIQIQDDEIIIDESTFHHIKHKKDIVMSQAPYGAMTSPFWGVSDRKKHKINNNPVVSVEDKKYLPIEKNKQFELSDEYQMFINAEADAISTGKVKTLDMKDWMIFLEICNRRDVHFQQTRWVRVYISDILNAVYQNDGSWAYKDLVTRLIRMRDITLSKKENESSVSFRSLVGDLEFKKDIDGRAYVIVHLAEGIYSSIIKEEFINVYGNEVKELELQDPFVNHLMFVVQKYRMLNFTEENKDIQFTLNWDHLSASIMMNKNTKKEVMSDIEEGLKAIEEKEFLIKTFKPFGKNSFIIVCYPLKNYELLDMRRVKIDFNENARKRLISENIEELLEEVVNNSLSNEVVR